MSSILLKIFDVLLVVDVFEVLKHSRINRKVNTNMKTLFWWTIFSDEFCPEGSESDDEETIDIEENDGLDEVSTFNWF